MEPKEAILRELIWGTPFWVHVCSCFFSRGLSTSHVDPDSHRHWNGPIARGCPEGNRRKPNSLARSGQIDLTFGFPGLIYLWPKGDHLLFQHLAHLLSSWTLSTGLIAILVHKTFALPVPKPLFLVLFLRCFPKGSRITRVWLLFLVAVAIPFPPTRGFTGRWLPPRTQPLRAQCSSVSTAAVPARRALNWVLGAVFWAVGWGLLQAQVSFLGCFGKRIDGNSWFTRWFTHLLGTQRKPRSYFSVPKLFALRRSHLSEKNMRPLLFEAQFAHSHLLQVSAILRESPLKLFVFSQSRRDDLEQAKREIASQSGIAIRTLPSTLQRNLTWNTMFL